jgi:hypothetical protein
VNKVEQAKAPSKVRKFLERRGHSPKVWAFIALHFDGDLSGADIHRLMLVRSGIDSTIITANPSWREYAEQIDVLVSGVIEKSIYDIVDVVLFDAYPAFLLQLFDEKEGEPVEYNVSIQETPVSPTPLEDMIRAIKEPKTKINVTKGTERPVLKPRWAEENRPKKQVKLRLQPDLIDEVDAAAEETGLTRNDWIEQAILAQLRHKSN